MVTTITEVLNVWNNMGVFSYVIPFLLIFTVVFAILKKTKILGDDNDSILAIIAVALGLLSLQFDFVSEFYAVIFPRFGIGLSLFLVILIILGFFTKGDGDDLKKLVPFGFVIGLGVIIWSLGSWNKWNDYGGFGGWFSENIWAILVVGVIIVVIAIAASSGKNKSSLP